MPQQLKSLQKKGSLSAILFQCLRQESNQRHMDFQSIALPTELPRHLYDPEGTKMLPKEDIS